MFEKTLKKPFLGLVAVCILIAASIPFQIGIDNIRGRFRTIEESLYISSSSLKKISFGYNELLADIYWIRVLQYFGSTGLDEQNPDLLYHYFDIITDLDPRFVNAYRYGGTFLAEPEPFGLGDLEKGTNLLDKGMKNNPENFRLPLEAAFLYYLYPKDYEKAAVLFKTASEKPGLSNSRKGYLSGMAATAHSQGGDRKLSRKIWEMIYETNPSENRRKFALMNIKEIDTMNIEDKLTLALREYIKSGNETPDSLDALVISGTLRGTPASPIGGEFVIAPGIVAVKNTELAQRRFVQHLGLLNAKSVRFRISNGTYPRDLAELRKYIELNTTAYYPEHPLGEEYGYDPETGKVTSGIKQ